MSFFFANQPASSTARLVKPRSDQTTQSGQIVTRRTVSAYWRGAYNYASQQVGTTLLAELERADALGAYFYAELYDHSGARQVPDWAATDTASFTAASFQTTDTDASRYKEGNIVSIRNTLDRTRVTARIIATKSESSGTYTFTFSTPLPQEYLPARPGVAVEVCFNRPHVSAKIKTESLQWTTLQREMRPSVVEWFEDTGGNLVTLHAASSSPAIPGTPAGQNRYLVNEAETAYIVTEDGRFLVTEH